MSTRLNVHDVIKSGGMEMVIMSLDPSHDHAIYFIPETKKTSSTSIRDLRKKLAVGEATTNAPATSSGLLRNMETQSAAFSRFLFNDAVVKRIKALAHGGKTIREAIKLAGETEITLTTGKTMPMCSMTQAYRLLRAADGPTIALLPDYSARGNRKPRYGERMKAITLQVIEDEYSVQKSRISLPFLTDIVTRRARAEGILPSNSSVSQKYVKSILLGSWNPDRDFKRLDPRIAKSAKAVAKQRIRPGAPLNRVEIDGLHLPFVAKIGERIIEEIWLVHAIDCETSHPLGWWITCAKPTTDDTFSCLDRAIYPKAELLKEMAICSSIDPFGSIANLVMDNGQENSKVRLASLTSLGIDLQWCEVNSGHRKPFIERLNRSLKEALESLPGCTRFNGKDGARKDEAMNDALMTLAALERWIVRWLFEVWPQTALERFITAEFEIDEHLGFTPAARWEAYEKIHSLPLCPPREDFERAKFLFGNGKLSAKTGISYETFTFRGDNLFHLIRQYGPDCAVRFYYNPHDYRTIYVSDRESEVWVRLVNSEVGANTPAYSFDDAKRRRKEKRATLESSPMVEKFMDDMVEASTAKPTRKQAKEAARKDAKDHERTRRARERANENPMEQSAILNADLDTYVAANEVKKLTKHKKTDRTAN